MHIKQANIGKGVEGEFEEEINSALGAQSFCRRFDDHITQKTEIER